MIRLLILAVAAGAAPAITRPAQPIAATNTPDPDSAHLAAARTLLDEMMPPAQREQMMMAITKPAIQNMRAALANDPRMSEIIGNNPRAHAVFDRLIGRLLDEDMATTRKSLPKLFDAMAVAYARNFTVAELDYIRAFYANPVGRTFMAKMPQIMADPAVQAAQREMVADTMSRIPAILREMKAEIAASSEVEK